MSKWQQLDITDKILQILRDIPDALQEHHQRRVFLTAYQIAIEFARRHPDEAAQLGFPTGGAGIGLRNSLAQYLSGQFTRNIIDGRIPEIEVGFLSNQHLKDLILLDENGMDMQSSLTGSGFPLSMFRLSGVG